MQLSEKALILAAMYDELDPRGQAALFALARSERAYLSHKSLHDQYCADPISDQSDFQSRTSPDPIHL